MSSSHKQKKKPAYDVTVRPINTSMISSIEELVGRFIDHSNNKTNPTSSNDNATNKFDHSDQNLNQNLTSVTQTPPVPQTQEPMSNRHVAPSIIQTPPISLTEVKGNLSLPNIILDSLLPQLEAFEQLIYLRLFRLSYGFRKNTCIVGMEKLATSCHISLSSTIRAIRELEKKGLIRKLDTKLGGKMTEIRGNIFWVFNPSVAETPPVTQIPASIEKAPVIQTPIKDHDHDDLKRQDHHQTEHEKNVMTIYKNVTGNVWTKADLGTYQKIKNIPLESIEIAIRLATQRASSRPNSLAFFVKEIIATANPKTNRSKQKKSMEKIVDRLRNSLVGSSYSMSDFVYKVKESCLREDIAFDNDLLDEILTK